ncbi:MAG: type II toxin-antitoxin system RelE/ParE family toxin [Lachnospiraceae bacterium]|nr:type II toxin-antitoxin system RelE/ParE family toxin [Lachnospiraceae bacterium]MBQ9234186.1 type II toxin-antitoxin system RelE/ParE family toxin [Lachnospiraceae bacterium]
MTYNLIITDRADELIDDCVYYIINKLKNPKAAKHLLDGISKLYDRLEDNPYQFKDSKDDYLRKKGYKEALVLDMQYKIIFRIEENNVYIVGLFHDLEDYFSKVTE